MPDDKGELDDTVAAAPQRVSHAPTVVETSTGTPGSWPTSSDSATSSSRLQRYRYEGVIGRGGMGEVVSARDDQIGRSVAIKRMRGDDPSPVAIARFLREARIQGRLEHPAVVPVHELWHDAEGRPFFVMKQLTGTPLSEVIDKLAARDQATTEKHTRQSLLRAFADVCLAVEFAHTKGVVHRDLKPANIVLGDFGEVYVLDWGIARVVGDPTASGAGFADVETLDGEGTLAGMVLGSPGYMSPEQLTGDAEIDGRSDVYALGCMLFEILALQTLHERGQRGIHAMLGVDARPGIRFPDRGIPPELDAICLAATMIERTDRYATARELGAAVQRFLDGDRDLAMRKQIAGDELAKARAEFARGTGAPERREALRAASRALALDPTNREPAELVARLMMEAPPIAPPEVESEIDKLDIQALLSTRWLVIIGALSFLFFLGLMYVAGFHQSWFHAIGVSASLLMLACGFAREARILLAMRLTLLCIAVMVGLYARVTTPFLIAPALGLMGVTVAATHPKVGRPGWIAVLFISAVLIPYVLEWVGVASETTHFTGNQLVLTTDTSATLDPTIGTSALVIYVFWLITLGMVMSTALTRSRRAAQRTVQIQAWQLEQLVPR